jgi:hypothetical protein
MSTDKSIQNKKYLLLKKLLFLFGVRGGAVG